jgi:putative oxidoreductase
MRNLVLPARILFALIFVVSGFTHFSQQTIGYAASAGVPLASLAVPVAGLIAIAGGASVMLGYKAKLGGWLLVLFLVPVTFMMHAFWRETDPAAMMMQRVHFMKNLSLLGGALLITYFGAGPLSVDAWQRTHTSHRHPLPA